MNKQRALKTIDLLLSGDIIFPLGNEYRVSAQYHMDHMLAGHTWRSCGCDGCKYKQSKRS